MSSTPDYTIDYGSFGVQPQAPRSNPDAPLYASEDGVVASLSNNECIFQVIHLLCQMRRFRPVTLHRVTLIPDLPLIP